MKGWAIWDDLPYPVPPSRWRFLKRRRFFRRLDRNQKAFEKAILAWDAGRQVGGWPG